MRGLTFALNDWAETGMAYTDTRNQMANVFTSVSDVGFRESKYFAEWAAGHTSLEVQEVLAEVQINLALWQRRVAKGDSLESIAEEPQKWSQKLFTIAGLI